VATFDDCALTVQATCVSRPAPDRAIVDAGSKALGLDRTDLGAGPVLGALRDRPQVVVSKVYEEHGLLTSSQPGDLPALGERVAIVPAHCCFTVNLHDRLWISADGAWETWQVAARGKVS
jgi:D-serine deaminase-like pyridoxal phosphate-dependent protein